MNNDEEEDPTEHELAMIEAIQVLMEEFEYSKSDIQSIVDGAIGR